jgi:hypothetical protein
MESLGDADIPVDQAQPGKTRLLRNGPIFASWKTSESFEKSPFSGVEEHGDLRVTSCLQNVSAHISFARSESEKISNLS